ncbi:MAG: hypothetical protein LBD11_08840 [Candidatus Peribacteria bacterium]|jgi:hypothetical protein|nr:hypothetical protein [Candidatus Peribacteria bacterium]
MDSTQQTPISSNTTLSALTGILFFGPWIKTPDPFIQGYCRVGRLNIVLFVITIILSLINYFLQTVFLQRITTLTSLAICSISAFCIVACLNEIALQAIMPAV